ncbi:hypothetical protein [Microbacterium sp. KR10-403]|uniref:hypothetical protein n=1 Tax=Microbacterium sp. KR10-403 TaxID=3158581 RepID=UPI0032E36B3B
MSIRDHLTPATEERAALVRDALGAAIISRATREAGVARTGAPIQWDELDPAIENVLSRITPRALEAITIDASSTAELRAAFRKACEAKLVPTISYDDEELEL